MNREIKKSGVIVAFALLVGFIAGGYFRNQGSLPKQMAEGGILEDRGEVREERPKTPSPLSRDTQPQSAVGPSGKGAEEIPPEVLSRLTNGYYVLQYEIPAGRLGLSNHVEMNVSQYRAIIDREYDPVFKDLGLNEGIVEKLKSHLASIQHARVEAEAYLVQLDQAKIRYDQQMNQILGAEQYRAYRETESGRPAMRELSTIKSYLEREGGSSLTTPEEASLFEALKSSKQIPVFDGPYGQGVYAGAGREKALAGLAEMLSLLQVEHNSLLKNLSESGASDVLRAMVNDYYAERERNKQEEINLVASAP